MLDPTYIMESLIYWMSMGWAYTSLLRQTFLNSLLLGYLHLPEKLDLEAVNEPVRLISYAPEVPFVTTHNPLAHIQNLPVYLWWYAMPFTWVPWIIILLLRITLKILCILVIVLNKFWGRVQFIRYRYFRNRNVNNVQVRVELYWVGLGQTLFWGYLHCWFAGSIMVGGAVLASWLCIFNIIQHVALYFIDPMIGDYNHCSYRQVRSNFRNLDNKLKPHKQGPGHSHPKQAELRNAVDELMNNFITDSKFNIYAIQKSARDVNLRIPGSLDVRWPIDAHSKDDTGNLTTQMRNVKTDPMPARPFIKMVNVDYYLDWLRYLWMDVPFIFFTATPETPAGHAKEINWTFRDNKLEMRVEGGAYYPSELWDYSVTEVIADYPGIRIIYHVDVVRVDTNWSVVLFTPYSRTRCFVSTPRMTLKRRHITHKVFTFHKPFEYTETSIISSGPGSNKLQFAMPGSHHTVVLGAETVAYLRSCALSRKMEAQNIFHGLVGIMGQAQASSSAQITFTHFPIEQLQLPHDVPPLRLSEADVNYNAATDLRDGPEPPSKPVAKVLCNAVIPGGIAAAESKTNDSAAVATRIQAICKDTVKFPVEYLGYVDEFIAHIYQNRKLAPTDIEEVKASLKRETQRQNYEREVMDTPCFMDHRKVNISAFQKKEVYNALKDPRNISAMGTDIFIIFSKYTQSLSKHLMNVTKWYAFGQHPDTIAETLHVLAKQSTVLMETDFSRFDGTHTHALREMEQKIMKAGFGDEFASEIQMCYDAISAATGRTRNGVFYNLVGTRASGSADTSIGNTLCNALFNYIDRRCNAETPEIAYRKLGMYGGDDGLTPDPYDTVESRAVQLNLKLKRNDRKPGTTCSFLGRIYIDLWFSPKHMCDPTRVINRLHVTAELKDQSPTTVLANRCEGYLVTDPKTALISNWVWAFIRSHPNIDVKSGRSPDDSTSYSVRQYYDGDQIRNLHQVTFDESLPIMASMLNIGIDILRKYCAYLDTITTLKQFNELKPIEMPHAVDETKIVKGYNTADILQAVDDSKRASTMYTRPVSQFERDDKSLSPKACDESKLRKVYDHIGRGKVKRVVDLTAGNGYDSYFLSKYFKNDKEPILIQSCEADPTMYARAARNLAGHKMIKLDLMDSRGIIIKAGDLVMIDPLWDHDRTKLRYGGENVMIKVEACLRVGATVILRAPIQWYPRNTSDGQRVKGPGGINDNCGTIVSRDKETDDEPIKGRVSVAVYRMFTFVNS